MTVFDETLHRCSNKCGHMLYIMRKNIPNYSSCTAYHMRRHEVGTSHIYPNIRQQISQFKFSGKCTYTRYL